MPIGDAAEVQVAARSRQSATTTVTLSVPPSSSAAATSAAEDVKSHRQRHILTGALGAKSGAPRVELGRHDIRDGDRVLVASDGLTELVPDEAIAKILSRESDPSAASAALVAAALDEGGTDNVTVVVADCRLRAAT